MAWKAGVLQWEGRSSPLRIATDCYWLLCPHPALHVEEISFLLPYKAESLDCTLFTSGNAGITNSISSTAVPSFIHLATQNKHSSFMKLYLRHLDSSTESSLLYQSESSYMMQGKTYSCIWKRKKKKQVLHLNGNLGSPRDAELATAFVSVANFQLTSSIENRSGKHLQSSISLRRFNGYQSSALTSFEDLSPTSGKLN